MDYRCVLIIIGLVAICVPVTSQTVNEFITDPYITDEAKDEVYRMNLPSDYDVSGIVKNMNSRKITEVRDQLKNIDITSKAVINRNGIKTIVDKSNVIPKFVLENSKIVVTKGFEHKKYTIISRKTNSTIEYYPDGIGNTFNAQSEPFVSVDIPDENGINYSIITGVEKIATKEQKEHIDRIRRVIR